MVKYAIIAAVIAVLVGWGVWISRQLFPAYDEDLVDYERDW